MALSPAVFFDASATESAKRYVLLVGGVNYAGRIDITRGPFTISLQGPGGISTMTFTVEMDTTPWSSRPGPFRGRTIVQFYDRFSDLKFTGFIVHTSTKRTTGNRCQITVDVAGLDKLLDERPIIAWKSRPDTTRKRKYANDDDLVKAVLKLGALDDMIGGGTWIDRTNTDMDDITFKSQSVREALQEIADIAQLPSQYQTRRFYVDVNGILHYYRGAEDLNAPFRITEDERYVTTVRALAGLGEWWSGRVKDNGDIYGHGSSHIPAPVNGAVFSVDSLCLLHRELPSMRFNGSTGYLSPNDSSLHPGNTGSWFGVFKRSDFGRQQAIWSGGTDDILIGFDASDHFRVQKEGTGDGFVSDDTYKHNYVYHFVVTHSGSGWNVYINGSAISGTATSRTLSAGSNTVNIGRKKTSADQFYGGDLWGVGVTSAEMSASTVSNLYRIWRSVEPSNLVIDADSSDMTEKVYVKGSAAKGDNPGTGWVTFTNNGNPHYEPPAGPHSNGPVYPQEIIERGDSGTRRKRDKYGMAYMAAKAGTVVAASFSLTYDPRFIQLDGFVSCWRPGQTAIFTSAAQSLSIYELEVRQVDIDLLNATGVVKFDVTCGALPYSQARRIRSRGMA